MTWRTLPATMVALVGWIAALPGRPQVMWPGLKTAAPLTAKLTPAEEPMVGDFVIRAHYKVRGGNNWQAVFVLCKQEKSDDGYRLTLSPAQTTLTEIQLGLEVELAVAEGLGASRSGEIMVRRSASSFQVFSGRSLLLSAHDETFAEGAVAYGCVKGDVVFESVQVQPVQPVVFSDDFMRAEKEEGDWKPVSGAWQVKSLRNPLRSANAFTYLGRATSGPAVSLAGHWFWSDYRLGVSVKSTGLKGVGLITCYQNRGDYVLFEWTGRSNTDPGVRRLVSVQGGKRTTVSESKGGYRPGQWYALSVSVRGRELEAYIDGLLICSGTIEPAPGGKIGLCTHERKGTYFDDVWCQSNRDLTFQFETEGDLEATTGGAWQEVGGKWVVAKKGDDLRCEVRTASPARALVGSPTWSDYAVSADVARVSSGSAGVCFYYQSEDDYLLLRNSFKDPDVMELMKVSGDSGFVLASAKAPETPSPFRHLTARADRCLVTAYAEGQKLFEYFAPALLGGRAGLYAENCEAASFDNFSISFAPRDREPVFTMHEVFGGEVSMSNWAASQSDWTTVKAKVGAAEVDCLWHRAPFFGDAEIEAEVAAEKGSLALIVGATEQSPGSGYVLNVAGSTLTLSRNGAELGRTELKASGSTAIVRLSRNGSAVIAAVDGARRLFYEDLQPLEGTNVGWYATGDSARKESVNVYSDNVVTDTFGRAAVDWRTAGGTWAVRNRWQCDPRWSFFSGDNFQGPAVLWNKRAFEGDMTVEFAAGIQMARDRGSYGDYGRDIDLTLCADGRNTDSGYSFVFAGWGNKKNAIVRQGKVVAEAPPPNLDDNIHRKWFLLRAEKRGGHLKYFVDDQLVCEYEDAEPLTGNRLALWTYRCGIMVSRFRVSAQKIGVRESVDEPWPLASRTFYDTGS